MRVIAGTARGVPLKAPKGNTTRPTTDRVRESVFGILQDLTEKRVLDLFAGSGALGIEALSRGAAEAIFLDTDRMAVKTIKENLAKTRFSSKALVLPINALRFLSKPDKYCSRSQEGSFDLIFLDPPYASGLYEKTVDALKSSWIVAQKALVVVEHSARDSLLPEGEGFVLRRSERYGDTVVSFYRLTK